MVVQLWNIAEDFVESSTGQKSLEKVGEEYFDELVSRSLIQQRSIGDDEDSFEMHNLVHDLATNSSCQYPIMFNNHDLLEAVHIFSYNRGLYDSVGKFDKLYGINGLPTFLALPIQNGLLQNVNNPSVAFQANMKMKERIHELALEWDRGSTFSDSQVQRVVLEHLRPSTNLKSLTIKGYGGFSIPNWLSNFLFGNMVYLRISNCDKCIWLPPLGQLGNLKKLIIDSMLSIKSVGTKFYGNDNSPSFQPFPSLEILSFEDVPEWKEWKMIGGTTTNFPSLKCLLLSKCPKLRGDKPKKFPSLTDFELRGCPLLVE